MEILIVVTGAILFAALNILHVIVAFFQNPPYTTFFGVTAWYADYYSYLSHLTQGAMGKWTVTNLYTTEPTPASFFWWPNLLLGKLTAPLHLPPWIIYDVTLFIVTVIYLLLIYYAIRLIYPTSKSSRLISFFLALTSTGFFQIINTPAGVLIKPYDFWFNTTLAFSRLGGVVIHVLVFIFSLCFILVYARIFEVLLEGKKIRTWVFTGTLTGASLFLLYLLIGNPVTALMDIVSVMLTFLVLVIWRRKPKIILPFIITLLIVTLPSIVVSIVQWSAAKTPQFQYAINWERSLDSSSFINFILSTGPLAFIIPFGISAFLKKATVLRLLGVIFTFFPLLLYFSPIPKLVGMQYIRLLQPPAYVFLAGIGAQGIITLSEFFEKRIHTLSKRITSCFIMIVFILFGLPVLYWQLAYSIQGNLNDFSPTYIDTNLYNALVLLRRYPSGITIAPDKTSLFIPVVSGQATYIATSLLTFDYNRKDVEKDNFFNFSYSPDEANKFLNTNKIRYVIFPASYEKQQQFVTYYPFLTPLCRFHTVAIFEVK